MAETTLLNTQHFNLPDQLASGVWEKVQDNSAIARLAGSTPMICGKTDFMTFTGQPKAEFVGEGQQKSPAKTEFGMKTASVHKAQVTVRFNEEVQYAGDDYKTQALMTLRESLSVALARALDLGAIHGLNPATGQSAVTINDKLTNATIKITPADPEADIENAAGRIVTNGYVPTGLAIDPTYAWKFKTAKYVDGRKKYPELSMNIRNTSMIEGLTTAVADTVSASREVASPTGVCAVLGQWDAFKWGVVRDIPVQTIVYGDPDGQGDLKRQNQIALRAEVLYSWAVLDYDAFALIKGSGSVSGDEESDVFDGTIDWMSSWDEMTKGDIIEAIKQAQNRGHDTELEGINTSGTKSDIINSLKAKGYGNPDEFKNQLGY